MNVEQDIVNSLQVLRTGGVILFPTDTVWGLGADATTEKAVQRVFELKGRPGDKGLIILLADPRDIFQYISAPDPGLFDYLDALEEPTTVVLDGAIGLAENCTAPDGSVGIRIVKDEFCRHLVKRFGKPITATSANPSGEPTPATFAEVSATIRSGVDYIVQYRQQEETKQQASRLVRWNKDGTVTTLR
jgi:L-threonylcarbamoyladenylate synthase